MTTGWLPEDVTELFGPDATAEESYDLLTVDVPAETWTTALLTARARLGCTYFDWLSAVDEPGTGFRVSAHVVALHPVRRLLVRTTVPHEAPVLASAVEVYAGAAWHERETHEMFGVDFTGHPGLDHLLLPDSFEGHPLRKDFVLAARVAKAWPGAKEPGESEHGGPKRRQMLPPGVPDPNEWGPLKGQLPPAPARPARGARAGAAGAGAGAGAGERPARRTRSASAGSASQTAGETPAAAPAEGAATPPRRMRSASQGSASQGSASQTSATPRETPAAPQSEQAEQAEQATTGTPEQPQPQAQPEQPGQAKKPTPPKSSDAPWHNPRPTFDEKTGERTAERTGEKTGEEGAAPEPPTKPETPTKPEPPTKPETPDEDTPAGGDPA